MELLFACKSLASSLCVEARLLTQIFDTSSQVRLEECSTSCQLTALCTGPSTAVVLENCMLLCCIWQVQSVVARHDTFLHDLCPEPSTLHSLASSRRPTHMCVCVSVRLRGAQPFRRGVDLHLLSVGRNCVNGWYLETSSLDCCFRCLTSLILY
jgi:hypothetical protein